MIQSQNLELKHQGQWSGRVRALQQDTGDNIPRLSYLIETAPVKEHVKGMPRVPNTSESQNQEWSWNGARVNSEIYSAWFCSSMSLMSIHWWVLTGNRPS